MEVFHKEKADMVIRTFVKYIPILHRFATSRAVLIGSKPISDAVIEQNSNEVNSYLISSPSLASSATTVSEVGIGDNTV